MFDVIMPLLIVSGEQETTSAGDTVGTDRHGALRDGTLRVYYKLQVLFYVDGTLRVY